MLIYKILLIEIVLVVTTTIRRTSADFSVERCEKLINEAEVFDAGEDKGILNFRRGFKNLTIEKIENWIDRLPENASIRKEQKELTTKYFLSLLNGVYADIYFKEPLIWCSDKVSDLKTIGYIDIKQSSRKEATLCKKYIVGFLCTVEDLENGKFGILKKLYEKWSGRMISQTILYSLGYFNHVANYVMDERHMPEGFKSIKQFCTEESYKLLSQELETMLMEI